MALKAMRFMNLLLTGVLATIVAPEEPDGGSDPVGNDSYTPHAIAHSLRAGPAPIRAT